MFFNSLHFAIPSSIYSNIDLKANQVQYLKAIYRGCVAKGGRVGEDPGNEVESE